MAEHNHTCCDRQKIKKGLWSPEEDEILRNYIIKHGQGCWPQVPKNAGLQRCGKSCRLRWINYLRPDLKRGGLAAEEISLLIRLHSIVGNRWSLIVKHFPGRTDNEINNVWNSSIKSKICAHYKAAKSKSRKPSGDFPVHAGGIINNSQNLSFINPTNNLSISSAPMPFQGFVPAVPPPLPSQPTYIPVTNHFLSIPNLPTWPDFSYNPQPQVPMQNDSSLFEFNNPAFFYEMLQFVETFDGVTNFTSDVSTSNAGVNYPGHLENIESLMGFCESSTPSAMFAASSSTTAMPPVDLGMPIAEASSSLPSADFSSLVPLPCSGPFMWETIYTCLKHDIRVLSSCPRDTNKHAKNIIYE